MSKQITIDCYGNRLFLDQPKYMSTRGEKANVLVDEPTDRLTYMCFDKADAGNQPIHKVVKEGSVTTIMWGYGDWANRTTLEYPKTLNESMTVTVD